MAQLELPLFRSNPEIILNGWLHALLVLANYAYVMNDKNVSEYVRQNLQFFVKYHDAWYDGDRNISRYSDTSPHRVAVRVTSMNQSFRIIYRSKVPELGNYLVSPVIDLENKYSAFDVRISHFNPKNRLITMTITCSGLFDTWWCQMNPSAHCGSGAEDTIPFGLPPQAPGVGTVWSPNPRTVCTPLPLH